MRPAPSPRPASRSSWSPRPARPQTAKALRAGEIDVMWGGPLRVMMTRDVEPGSRPGLLLRRRGARSVLRHRPRAAARFPLRRSEGPHASRRCRRCRRRGSASRTTSAAPASIPTRWTASPTARWRRTRRRCAPAPLDAIQVFQPYAERLIASGAGHVWYAAATRGLTAYTTLVTRRSVLEQREDDLLKMTRAVYRTLGWFAATPAAEIAARLRPISPTCRPTIFAGAIDRYRSARPVGQRPGDPPRGL